MGMMWKKMMDKHKLCFVRRERARKTNWSNDLVDIVVNDRGYKTKLIFVNTKTRQMEQFMRLFCKRLKVGHLQGVRILLLTSIRSELNLRNV